MLMSSTFLNTPADNNRFLVNCPTERGDPFEIENFPYSEVQKCPFKNGQIRWSINEQEELELHHSPFLPYGFCEERHSYTKSLKATCGVPRLHRNISNSAVPILLVPQHHLRVSHVPV